MEKFIGTITYELRAKGSKSEGYASFLTLRAVPTPQEEVVEVQTPLDSDVDSVYVDIQERTTFQLYRTGVYAINDTFFEPYNDLEVEVEGVIMMEKWIDVKSIKLVEIE